MRLSIARQANRFGGTLAVSQATTDATFARIASITFNICGTLAVSQATTDAAGRYTLPVAPATYRPSADRGDYGFFEFPSVAITGTSAIANLTMTRYPVTITGRALAGSAPVAGVRPSAGCVAHNGSPCAFAFGGSSGGETTSDGSYVLRGEPGRYDPVVRSSTGGGGVNSTASTLVDATTSTSISGRDINASPSTTIVRGRVTDATTGSPLVDVEISLRVPQQGGAQGTTIFVARTFTDANGRYEVPAAPASYAIRASKAGYSEQGLQISLSGASATQDFALSTAATTTPTAGGTVTPTSTTTSGPPSQCPLRAQGDANCGGRFTLSDYTLWRNQFLGSDPAATADFNGDGRVTLTDYTIWRNSFLAPASSP